MSIIYIPGLNPDSELLFCGTAGGGAGTAVLINSNNDFSTFAGAGDVNAFRKSSSVVSLNANNVITFNVVGAFLVSGQASYNQVPVGAFMGELQFNQVTGANIITINNAVNQNFIQSQALATFYSSFTSIYCFVSAAAIGATAKFTFVPRLNGCTLQTGSIQVSRLTLT